MGLVLAHPEQGPRNHIIIAFAGKEMMVTHRRVHQREAGAGRPEHASSPRRSAGGGGAADFPEVPAQRDSSSFCPVIHAASPGGTKSDGHFTSTKAAWIASTLLWRAMTPCLLPSPLPPPLQSMTKHRWSRPQGASPPRNAVGGGRVHRGGGSFWPAPDKLSDCISRSRAIDTGIQRLGLHQGRAAWSAITISGPVIDVNVCHFAYHLHVIGFRLANK